MLPRSALEESPLADLHVLAAELGIDGYRRLRKADLIDRIVGAQGGGDDDGVIEDGVTDEDAGDETETETEAEAEAEERPARRRGRRGGRGRSRDADAEAEVEASADADDDGDDDEEDDAPAPRRSRGG